MDSLAHVRRCFSNEKYQTVIDLAETMPTNPQMLFYAALAYKNLFNYVEAIKLLKRALEINPYYENAMRELVSLEPCDMEKLAVYESMARANFANSNDLTLMARIYFVRNRFDDARHWFQRALENDSKNSMAILGLAEVHAKLAIHYLQEVADQNEIDLSEQLSLDMEAEDVLRFLCNEILGWT